MTFPHALAWTSLGLLVGLLHCAWIIHRKEMRRLFPEIHGKQMKRKKGDR